MKGIVVSSVRYGCLAGVLLACAACSGTNLGDIDESVDSREEMPGPGIFTDDEGESLLSWSSESEQAESTPAATPVTASDEQAEFEAFKLWNQLRSEGADSAEYREFQQWLEYRKFKSGGVE